MAHFKRSPACATAYPHTTTSLRAEAARRAVSATAMALVFPDPARPAAASARDAHARAAAQTHARAHGRWRAGQDHLRREQWPLAAQAFEQASALHEDSAYALAKQFGNSRQMGEALRKGGNVALERADFSRALASYR